MKMFKAYSMMSIKDFCDRMYSYVSTTLNPAIGQFNDVRIIMIHDEDFGKDEVVSLQQKPDDQKWHQ